MVLLNEDMSIFDMVNTYPETKNIMSELGFKDIMKPGMLQSAGRVMTLKKGSRMKNIAWEDIVKKFADYGFQFERRENDE